MSKTAAQFVALEFLKSKGTATPAEINAHVGKGNYAAKYVCYLKLYGYEIETVKDGRTVTEYKFISDGDSATRNFKWVAPADRGKVKTPKVKAAKVAKPKASKPVKVRQSKQTPSAPVSVACAFTVILTLHCGSCRYGIYVICSDCTKHRKHIGTTARPSISRCGHASSGIRLSKT